MENAKGDGKINGLVLIQIIIISKNSKLTICWAKSNSRRFRDDVYQNKR